MNEGEKPPTQRLADLPLLLTVEEAAALLRVGRSAMYAAVHSGDMPGAVRIGRQIRIPRAAIAGLIGEALQDDHDSVDT